MPVPYSSRNLLSLSGNHVFHLYCSCVEDKVSWCCCCPPVPLTGFHRRVKDTLCGFNWSLTFFLNRFHHPHLYCKADLILILKKLNDLFFHAAWERYKVMSFSCLFVSYCYWLWLEPWTDSVVQLLGKSRDSSLDAFVIRIMLTEPMEFGIKECPCSPESSVIFTNRGASTEVPDNKGAAGGHCSREPAQL